MCQKKTAVDHHAIASAKTEASVSRLEAMPRTHARMHVRKRKIINMLARANKVSRRRRRRRDEKKSRERQGREREIELTGSLSSLLFPFGDRRSGR